MKDRTEWTYDAETSIQYQGNAGQTFLPAENNTSISRIMVTAAPAPKTPLPIQLELRPDFQSRGFSVSNIGRQEYLPGVTAEMLDWFWSNMEKGYYLWAPGEHKSFRWLRAPAAVGFLSSAHEIVEPAGPIMMRIQISRLDPKVWYPFTDCLDHVICEGIFNSKGELNDSTIHMWQDVPGGCIHISSSIQNEAISELPACIQKLEADMEAFMRQQDRPPNTSDELPHGEYESATWPVFLPTLYGLWKNHPDPSQNVFFDLTVERTEDGRFCYVSEKTISDQP